MLRQQGIEIAGVFDKEKDIWVYVKDGEVFFCKGDLVHIDRKTIGLAQDVLALTESDDSVRVIGDEEDFTNFIVIDKNNKVLSRSRNNNRCILKRMRTDSFVIVNLVSWERCNQPYYMPSIERVHQSRMDSFTFIDGNYLQSYHLWSIYGNIYFFSFMRGKNGLICGCMKMEMHKYLYWKMILIWYLKVMKLVIHVKPEYRAERLGCGH